MEIKQFVVVTDDPEFCLGTTLLFIDTRNNQLQRLQYVQNMAARVVCQMSNTLFTPAKHVLLNWFSLNENYKQRTEKLDFPLDSSTC